MIILIILQFMKIYKIIENKAFLAKIYINNKLMNNQ